MLFVRPLHPGRLCGGWVSVYPFGLWVAYPCAFVCCKDETNFKVPVLADTLFTLSREGGYPTASKPLTSNH